MAKAEYDGWRSGSFNSHNLDHHEEWSPSLSRQENRQQSRNYFDEALTKDDPDVELYYQQDKENLLVADPSEEVVVIGGTTPGNIQTMFKPDTYLKYVDDRAGGTPIRVR